MKKLVIIVSDSFVRKEIEISVSEKEYNKLMKVYDEEYGLEFKIKEVKWNEVCEVYESLKSLFI